MNNPIIIYLLALFLVYKGLEMFLTALITDRHNPSRKLALGIGIVAMGSAAFFAVLAVLKVNNL